MDDHEPDTSAPASVRSPDGPGCQSRSRGQTESTGHPWACPDRRLEQKIDELERRLDDLDPDGDDQRRALGRARDFATRARFELDRPSARNQEAWTWFHAARREQSAAPDASCARIDRHGPAFRDRPEALRQLAPEGARELRGRRSRRSGDSHPGPPRRGGRQRTPEVDRAPEPGDRLPGRPGGDARRVVHHRGHCRRPRPRR